jgi:hypothetical protein
MDEKKEKKSFILDEKLRTNDEKFKTHSSIVYLLKIARCCNSLDLVPKKCNQLTPMERMTPIPFSIKELFIGMDVFPRK